MKKIHKKKMCTCAPSSFMRGTLEGCLSISRLPIRIVQERPSLAHTAAVATPFWPEPVAVTMLVRPICLASMACARALLIL